VSQLQALVLGSEPHPENLFLPDLCTGMDYSFCPTVTEGPIMTDTPESKQGSLRGKNTSLY
jgi:hypothetical protein